MINIGCNNSDTGSLLYMTSRIVLIVEQMTFCEQKYCASGTENLLEY